MQIGEFLGILPNKACKGTRSRILWDESHFYHSLFIIRLPGTEIPKWLKLNHESDGYVISFWVGCKFPNIFFLCFAFGPLKYPRNSIFSVCLSINGCRKEHLFSTDVDELSDHLWIVSLTNKRLQDQLNKSNPSEQNYVEVICETKHLDERWIGLKTNPRGWGIGVECICHRASNSGGGSRHQCRQRRRNHRPTYARRPQKHYLSHFGWLRIRFLLWKRSSRPTLPSSTLVSRYFLLFYYSSLSVWKTKEKETNKFCVFSVLFFCFLFFVFFFLFGKLKGSEGNGRERSQGFRQWSRRFRAFNHPHGPQLRQ